MGRTLPFIVAVITLSATSGCGAVGWYRSSGHLPGIAVTDYAFTFFCGTASQLYPFSPPQVEGAGRNPYVKFTLQCLFPEKVRY